MSRLSTCGGEYWSFSISPSNEYSGLISFRIDWFNLLAVQGTLKSLLQNHSSKASIWHSTLFMVQLSHLYVTTGKTITLTIRTFVGKVVLLCNNKLYSHLESKAHYKALCYIAYSVMSRPQLCLTLCSPMDCSPPGSTAHGLFQARIVV